MSITLRSVINISNIIQTLKYLLCVLAMVNRFQMLYFSTLVWCKPWKQRKLLSARKNKTTSGNCQINLPTGLVYLHIRNRITFIWRFTTTHKIYSHILFWWSCQSDLDMLMNLILWSHLEDIQGPTGHEHN